MNNNTRSDIGPFAIIPLWLIKSGISPGAIVTFALMWAKWADKQGECWPSHARIAEHMNISERTTKRYIEELGSVGAITVVHRQRDDGSQTSNFYVLHAVPPRDTDVMGGGHGCHGGGDMGVMGGVSPMAYEPYPEEPYPLNPPSSSPLEPTDNLRGLSVVEDDSDSKGPQTGAGPNGQGAGLSYPPETIKEVAEAEAILVGEGHGPKNVDSVLRTGDGDPAPWTYTNRRTFPAETLAEVVRLAVEFSDACKAAGNKRPNPYAHRAANAMRLLLVNDKKEARHIRALIAWTFNDHFWYCNVLSTPKFRERWDQLAGRRRDDLKKSQMQHERDKGATGEDWMARSAR